MPKPSAQPLSSRFKLGVTLLACLLAWRACVRIRQNHVNALLFDAARTQDATRVAAALQAGAEIFATNRRGATALDIAATRRRSGQPINNNILEILLDRLPNRTYEQPQNEKILCYAARCGRTDIIRRLLAHGIMVNAGAPLTPLVYAVTGEQVESARFLLDQGADIGVLRVEMIAPALLDGNTKLVSLLLERGFNVNARQQAREAPVGNDAPIDTTSTEVPVAKQDMRLRAELLKSEMDRLLHDKIQASNNIAGKQATLNGMTPLMWATMDTHTGKMADHLTTVRCLLTCKPDVNATDREGRTALDYALAGDPGADNQGICLLARLLIAHGANVHTTNHNGVTTVMYAARAGHLDAIKLLLAAGVDINAQDIKGMTVLMGTMVTNSLGYDEVHIDYHPIVALLLAHGANIQILPGVVAYCKREDIELLIRRGADVNGRDRHGNTALHNAAVFGKSDNVRALLEHGADPNRTNNQGTTALLRAAGSFLFTPEIVTMLLRRGANPKARDNQGKTALHYAVLGNRSDVMKQLLDLGLDPNSTDQHGDTPLLTMLKGYRPNLRLVKILLDHYANVNVPDQAGTRPLQIAIAKGYLDIVEKLKQAGAR